jgi:hypothetical protein
VEVSTEPIHFYTSINRIYPYIGKLPRLGRVGGNALGLLLFMPRSKGGKRQASEIDPMFMIMKFINK